MDPITRGVSGLRKWLARSSEGAREERRRLRRPQLDFDRLEQRWTPAALTLVAFSPISEGGYAAISITLDASSTDTITVDYATSDGTAKAGSDYTSTSGTATFTPGQTAWSGKASVPTADDALDEDDETFTVTLSNPTNAPIGTGSRTATIADNDATPYVLPPSGGSAPESDRIMTVSVGLSAASSKTVTVDYAHLQRLGDGGRDERLRLGLGHAHLRAG